MATNAPYYQMRAGQLSTVTENSIAATQTDQRHEERYNITPSMNIGHSTENQHLPIYTENSTRQPEGNSQHNELEETRNLAELLEAASTAADQESAVIDPDRTAPVVPNVTSKNKRKRGSDSQIGAATSDESPSQNRGSSPVKRCRVDTSSTDPSLQNNSNGASMYSSGADTGPSTSGDISMVDTGSAGVHSAAALFRRTSSSTTRKYTRPPMSKLFMSLNITPENFIALQALAKAYMLSPAHPERQSCVGNRGRGDTDMVRLRLFNCVRDFLTDSGVGQQFFGEHVEKPGERESIQAAAALGEKEGGEKLIWPRDGNKIISLVTPLMRRMVTNERQRLYAIDTRKGGSKAEKEPSVEASIPQSLPATPTHGIDPALQRSAAQRSSPFDSTITHAQTSGSNAVAPSTPNPTILSSPAAPPVSVPAETTEPHLTNINIFLVHTSRASKSTKLDEKRISTTRPAHLTFYNYSAFIEQVRSMVSRAEVPYPSVDMPQNNSEAVSARLSESESLRGLAAAANALQPDREEQQHQSTIAMEGLGRKYTVKTLGQNGWQVIESAETWYHVLTERAFAVWADGICNIIVELEGAQPRAAAKNVGSVDEGMDGEVLMDDM